ncbi:SPOSA6832_03696, partial [Sporobolomyces salmonicolor]
MPRRYDSSEPRKASLAKPYVYQSNDDGLADIMAMASMACSGMAMISRFAIWPWFGLLLATSSLMGRKNLGPTKPGQENSMMSGWTCLMFAFTALMSIYTPLLMGQVQKAGGLPIGFNKGLIPVMREVPGA